jgi:hypothetical protein
MARGILVRCQQIEGCSFGLVTVRKIGGRFHNRCRYGAGHRHGICSAVRFRVVVLGGRYLNRFGFIDRILFGFIDRGG